MLYNVNWKFSYKSSIITYGQTDYYCDLGDGKMNHLKKELNKLWTGELASIILFCICYLAYMKHHTIVVIYPLGLLCFILLQGSVYWWISLQRLTGGKKYRKLGSVYRGLKWTNNLLLAGYFFVVVLSPLEDLIYYVLSGFLFLFSIVEFINYYYWRLSYKGAFTVIKQITSHSLRKSKIALEIEYAIKNKIVA